MKYYERVIKIDYVIWRLCKNSGKNKKGIIITCKYEMQRYIAK